MGHGCIPVGSLSDHGISTSAKCFQIVCSLAHKKDVNGDLEEIQFFVLFDLFLVEFFGLEMRHKPFLEVPEHSR